MRAAGEVGAWVACGSTQISWPALRSVDVLAAKALPTDPLARVSTDCKCLVSALGLPPQTWA